MIKCKNKIKTISCIILNILILTIVLCSFTGCENNDSDNSTNKNEVYEYNNDENSSSEYVNEKISNKLADVVKVGDYVNYDASSGLTTPITYTTDESLTGSSETKTFSSSDSMKWRVLNVDKATGKVELIAENPTSQELELKEIEGYINAEDVLNDIGAVYGHGNGATGGRSIKLEDIEQYSSYNPEDSREYGRTQTYTKGAYFVNIGNGTVSGGEPNTWKGYKECIQASVSNPVTVKQLSRYGYSAENFFENKTIYKMLFKDTADTEYKNSYWLASRNVSFTIDSSSGCYFDVCCIRKGTVVAEDTHGSGGDPGGGKYRVMPIVSLKSNILISGKDESGVWQLSL